MSIQVMALVLGANLEDIRDRRGRRITPAVSKSILIVLANHVREDGDGAWPSLEKMARWAGVRRRVLIDALRALEDAGILIRVGRTPRGVVRYRISVSALKDRQFEDSPLRSSADSSADPTPHEESLPRANGGAPSAPGGCAERTGGVRRAHRGGALSAPGGCAERTRNDYMKQKHETPIETSHEPHGAAREGAPQGGGGMGQDPEVRKSFRSEDSSWVPEHLRDLYEAFVKEAGFGPVSKGERARWLADLERMRSAGLEPWHVSGAVRECRSRGLLIKSPASVMTAARNLAAREEQWGRPLSWEMLAARQAARWRMGSRQPWDQAPQDLREAFQEAARDLEMAGIDGSGIVPVAFRKTGGAGSGYVIYVRGGAVASLSMLQRLERRMKQASGFPVTIHAEEDSPGKTPAESPLI